MTLCSVCGKPTSTGRTGGASHYRRCLICETKDTMASFVYKGVPRPAIDRAALRAIRQEEQRIYWQAYYKKNKDALRTQRKMRIWKTGE